MDDPGSDLLGRGPPRAAGTSAFGCPASNCASLSKRRPIPTKERPLPSRKADPWSDLGEAWSNMHSGTWGIRTWRARGVAQGSTRTCPTGLRSGRTPVPPAPSAVGFRLRGVTRHSLKRCSSKSELWEADSIQISGDPRRTSGPFFPTPFRGPPLELHPTRSNHSSSVLVPHACRWCVALSILSQWGVGDGRRGWEQQRPCAWRQGGMGGAAHCSLAACLFSVMLSRVFGCCAFWRQNK